MIDRKYRIMEVALELHMHCNGSAESLTQKELYAIRHFLGQRLLHWQRSLKGSSNFDEAVRLVCSAACVEYDQYKETYYSRKD